ncbi:MAG: N-acetylmuramoyl-L-alanine amidase, partial [Deltaproteobacteria bacterium]|nr:N-acetylmuramoyl-L-alanine amidase [Deltaproteobacteria bacterium]
AEDHEPNGIETFFLGMGGDDPEADGVASRENLEPALAGLDEDRDLDGIIDDLKRNGDQAEASRLAETIQKRLARAMPESIDRNVRQGRFTVLEKALMPAVVVEVGFITNPKEGLDLLLAPYQERLALALRDAVMSYLHGRMTQVQAGNERALAPALK